MERGGGVNHRLLFRNNIQLFSLLFSGIFCGGDKVMIGGIPSPHQGKPCYGRSYMNQLASILQGFNLVVTNRRNSVEM